MSALTCYRCGRPAWQDRGDTDGAVWCVCCGTTWPPRLREEAMRLSPPRNQPQPRPPGTSHRHPPGYWARALAAVLAEHGPLTHRDIAARLRVHPWVVRKALQSRWARQFIERMEDGRWRLRADITGSSQSPTAASGSPHAAVTAEPNV
jgi:hypothetical protein